VLRTNTQLGRVVRVDPLRAPVNHHRVQSGENSHGADAVRDEPMDLRSHAEMVGNAVRSSLEAAVLAISGPKPRPAHLIARIGIDKTLAGRILQTVSASDPLMALSRSPSPGGLSIFLQAARDAGTRQDVVDKAASAVHLFETLLERFPPGRSGLDVAISGWTPATREQGERAARQAAFKSMSYILGYQSEVTLVCSLLKPSADGNLVDVVYVGGQFGLRRLRAGEPLSVFGIRYYPVGDSKQINQNATTLDGRPVDQNSCLLSEFCDPHDARLEMVQTKDQRLFVLPVDEPVVNEPVSIVIGHMTKGSWRRYASDDRREEWATSLTRCPTRVAISDVFIHEDVYPGVEPVVTTHAAGVSPLPARERGPTFPLDEVHLSKEVGWVNRDVSNIGTGEIPRYPEIVASMFERLGEDPRKYRTHRTRSNYPVSGIVTTRWFKLPERPPGK
jgi:hypothetical protein